MMGSDRTLGIGRNHCAVISHRREATDGRERLQCGIRGCGRLSFVLGRGQRFLILCGAFDPWCERARNVTMLIERHRTKRLFASGLLEVYQGALRGLAGRTSRLDRSRPGESLNADDAYKCDRR